MNRIGMAYLAMRNAQAARNEAKYAFERAEMDLRRAKEAVEDAVNAHDDRESVIVAEETLAHAG